jgi:cell division protein FtsA
MANMEIRDVQVGIAGQHIKSLQHQGILTLADADKEINPSDIQLLMEDMHKLALPPGDKILHIIPQEYAVDSEEGIVDPVGMCGHRLYGNFHVITGQMTAYNNITRCVERAGLNVSALTLEPIASAAAVLSEEEKEAGVALVDIGGGTTDITIFQEGIIRHTAVVPFGGDVITRDIKEGCTVMHDQAEKLKIKFGSALGEEIVDNRIITIPGLKGRDPKEISEKNLARIIQARLEEILDLVLWEIKRSGYDRKLIAGMVLTGGGALLKNIAPLAEYHTGLGTRIGLPTEHLASGYRDEMSSPIYATAIGLLIHGIDMYERVPATAKTNVDEETVEAYNEPRPMRFGGRFIDKMFNKTKEFFEATPDHEL